MRKWLAKPTNVQNLSILGALPVLFIIYSSLSGLISLDNGGQPEEFPPDPQMHLPHPENLTGTLERLGASLPLMCIIVGYIVLLWWSRTFANGTPMRSWWTRIGLIGTIVGMSATLLYFMAPMLFQSYQENVLSTCILVAFLAACVSGTTLVVSLFRFKNYQVPVEEPVRAQR